MSVQIFTTTKSHGNASTFQSGAGHDQHTITIPSQNQYTRYTISQASGHAGAASFVVTKAPKPNATGKQSISVMWTNGPFSRCRYSLKAFAQPVATGSTPSVTRARPRVTPKETVVTFGAPNWYNDVIANVNQGIRFKLRVQGTPALQLFNALDPLRRGIVTNELVTITVTAIICVTILGGLGLTGFTAAVLYGIHRGCNVKALYDNDMAGSGGTSKQNMDMEFMNCQAA